jgi:hypothetical protein
VKHNTKSTNHLISWTHSRISCIWMWCQSNQSVLSYFSTWSKSIVRMNDEKISLCLKRPSSKETKQKKCVRDWQEGEGDITQIRRQSCIILNWLTWNQLPVSKRFIRNILWQTQHVFLSVYFDLRIDRDCSSPRLFLSVSEVYLILSTSRKSPILKTMSIIFVHDINVRLLSCDRKTRINLHTAQFP